MQKYADAPDGDLQALALQHREALDRHTSELQSMAATMRELEAASHEIADNARRVSQAAARTVEQARLGEQATAGMVSILERIHENASSVHEALAALAEQVAGIGAAVEVIDELSDRVDLLALNAALEGARAGEAGKGLQIIAAEMRRLAERVAGRTRGIRDALERTQEATEAALAASERNRDVAIDAEELGLAATVSLGEILGSVEETNAGAAEIGVATAQQQDATEGALRAIVSATDAGVSLRVIAETIEDRILGKRR